MASVLSPTLINERIQSLDIIRGIAILGILIMNIQSFSMPGSAYSNPMAFGDLNGINKWVWIFDPCDENFEHETICLPNSSSVGEHWNGPFPYGKGPIKVYAPQNTHPHPRFSPDDRKVVYTSDCSGFSQIYEVSIPNHHWSS